MKRHRPDADQGLFRWFWHDPADDRPDLPEEDGDDDEPRITPPPLRDRITARQAPCLTVPPWGTPVRVARRVP